MRGMFWQNNAKFSKEYFNQTPQYIQDSIITQTYWQYWQIYSSDKHFNYLKQYWKRCDIFYTLRISYSSAVYNNKRQLRVPTHRQTMVYRNTSWLLYRLLLVLHLSQVLVGAGMSHQQRTKAKIKKT